MLILGALEGHGVADLLAARIQVLLRDGHLMHVARKAALYHTGLVEAGRGERFEIDLLAQTVYLGVSGLGVTALRDFDAAHLAERGDVGFVQAERRFDRYVEQALSVVVIVGGEAQVVAGRLEAHQHGGAERGDHEQRDEPLEVARDGAFDIGRECTGPNAGLLPPHDAPAYHSMSAMGTGRSFTCMSVTRPLLKRIRRSAMGASAELCVMMSTVMPSRRQVSCSS